AAPRGNCFEPAERKNEGGAHDAPRLSKLGACGLGAVEEPAAGAIEVLVVIGVEHDAENGAAAAAIVLPIGILALDFLLLHRARLQRARDLAGRNLLRVLFGDALGIDYLDVGSRHLFAPSE